MIEKMTKYSFVLMGGSMEKFLEELQNLGVVDITRSSKPIDDRSLALMKEIEEKKNLIGCIGSGRDAHLEELEAGLGALLREKAVIEPWGEYDRPALAALGLGVCHYSVKADRFDPAWEEQWAIQKVLEKDGTVWFVVIGGSDGFPLKPLPAPTKSLGELEGQIASAQAGIKEYEAELLSRRSELEGLGAEVSELSAQFGRHLAALSAETAAEGSLVIFEGYSPCEGDAALQAELDKMDVVYLAGEAEAADNPPIKLRNNWFARQFETLTGMYGMPVYDEWDPTPILAPFFMLFFALCMGDAGYGLLLIAIAYALKSCKGEGPMGLAKHWRLIRTLGAATLVVGFFLGTFFGISLADQAWFPDSLKKVLLTGNLGAFPLQMVLALGIGVLHICLAMVVKTALYTKRFGFKEMISTWGWTLLIVGGLAAFIVCSVMHLSADLTKWIIIGIAVVSALGIFIFNKPGRNPLLNVGAGLWDTYQMATGVLGDVLSYIRLYALGLAGGMLGSAFNTLGGMVLGEHPTFQWLFFIIIVVFGHALNLAMSCLGAFVHPLRLTFVEYFKNSGYEGRGRAFNPLRKDK